MHRAKLWLRRYGRPLELARWEFLFEGGSPENVLRYLAAFQNDDGGFGHGLEPDFWLPDSSPMATWTAGQILTEIKASHSEPIVERLLKYLTKTPQVQPGMWPSVQPENNQHPHAPWWHWNEGAQQGWMFNPSVELAAFLIRWSPAESAEARLGWESLKHALRRVMQTKSMDRHELNNYRKSLRLLSHHRERFSAQMEHTSEEVQAKVHDLTRRVIDKDVSNWGKGYKPLPLDFIQSPNDPLYPELKELVDENLQFYLEQRDDDGIWNITWNWGRYPEEFAVAGRYWQGILAVERYLILKAFGREAL